VLPYHALLYRNGNPLPLKSQELRDQAKQLIGRRRKTERDVAVPLDLLAPIAIAGAS